MSHVVVALRRGGPEVLELRSGELGDPTPNQVRVRVEAAGVSFADLLMCRGLHPERRRPPFVPGWDVVGRVDAVGPGVRAAVPSDRIAALSIVGGWAEHAIVPASLVVAVPPAADATAAVCPVMDYVVAHQMLTRYAHLKRGDTVLVQGAAGGVGTAVMQLARAQGLQVVGTDTAAKRAHVESEGGVLVDFQREDVVERCRALTGGRGVDAALDGIGATARTSLRALRPGGRLVWFGMITMLSGGRRDLAGSARTIGNVGPVLAQNLRPRGRRASLYSIQRLAQGRPEWYREDLSSLLGMLTAGEIAPRFHAIGGLREVPAALRALADGRVEGKQVIAVA